MEASWPLGVLIHLQRFALSVHANWQKQHQLRSTRRDVDLPACAGGPRDQPLPNLLAARLGKTGMPIASITAAPLEGRTKAAGKGDAAAAAQKAELGRATWLFLHTLAAQYPEQPTAAQRRDVKAFITNLARVYPCRDCSKHFEELVR